MKIGVLQEKADLLCNNLSFEFNERPCSQIENGNIKKTIDFCLNEIAARKEPELLLICGSFFIMRDCFECFGVEIETDEVEMNEA